MKTSSESGPYSTNQRPFFYAQPTAQQPFPNPWFLGPMYNPYGMPTAGLRSGNPYFPFYSVPIQEYPGYLVPQHPMQMRVNRRPYFNGPPPSSPMFYQATRFRHYNPGKRTETKETQTDPKQPESKPKKYQDHSIETKGCDTGNIACVSSGVCKGTEISLEKPESSVSPVSDRDFAKSSSGSVQFRSLPPPGYAFEKEEVRIEYGNGGAPAIQLWKSFKETIPLYDVAKKPVAENVMQRDMFALSSCEGVVYGPHEQAELVPSISYSEEQKTVEDVQEKELQYKAKLELEKQGVTSHRAKSPLDEARAVQLAEPTRPDLLGARQDVLMPKRSSGLKRSNGSKAPQDVSNLVRQRELFPSGMEIRNDSYFPQKLNENNNATDGHLPGLETSLWCDESQKYIPSESWLACLDNMDANYNYNMYLSQRKRPSVLSLTSDEMSSVDEGSSTDNVPVSYFAPDYMLQNMCTFKKHTEGLEREKIKSGGSLNEDEEVGGIEQANISHSQNFKGCSRVKIKEISSQSSKLGILPRSSSRKQLYSLKKKATKSLSLSEPDDSEEYWVKELEEEEEEEEEEEYLNQESSKKPLTPTKSGLSRQTGQQVIWRIPKHAVPAHLISWPVQEKLKTAPKLKKDQEQDEDLDGDYSFWLQRPTAQPLEVLELRRNSQKCSGRLQKEGGRIAADEYWIKSGARPKFASLVHGGLLPTTRNGEKGDLPIDMPKKKGARKPPHKRRDTRHDVEVEEWEKPKTTQHKGRPAKRSLYRRR
ncbi:uncharacterized protein LOC133364941 [Rhineura floridana]|uniref:uncharacterized protein LOC133364941 n=1 Tax=Rhineura floridana TaxID=261503 RepID=UPI002AC7FC60|nr:uncharacterized protein LOC133364941 [Rhineura floridana]XP_061442016.1 uncharacterized protein LOC133364941 [Rhineura floridana]XP_061442017.1 uncharacterized protein LOC133364941 [Rhineura floridana]